MESASSSFRGSWLLFSLLLIISPICFVTVRLLRQLFRTWYCNCEICSTYIKSSWNTNFPNLCDWYTHLLKNSPTRTIHIHVLNNVITANPDNVEYMLKTRFHNFPKGKPFSAILGDFLGRGIFNVDGDTWRFQRKMASLELGRASIRAYSFQVVDQEIDRFLIPLMEPVADTNEALDLQDAFRIFSFYSICRFSFGLDPNSMELWLPLTRFAQAFDLASKLSAERAMCAFPIVWKIKRLLNIGTEKQLQQAIRTVHVLAGEFIKQRKKQFGSSDRNDLLSRFMSSVNDETYLRDIVVSFLLAGRDTVASALTGFFRLVACHPEVEAGILSEAGRVIGSSRGPASYEQMRELNYLHAAIYESMRLYPPIQFNSKYCLNDDVLADGSTFVKMGTRVTYHPYAMGRMEEIWGSDCLEFKPERWLRDDGVFCHEKNAFKFPVFQAGIRVCLGKEVALLEMKCVVVSLLRRFRFELGDDNCKGETTPRFSPGLTATFCHGLRVLVRDRGVKS